ncbi:MAG: acetate--CoA ligase [Verrucomicrobia bacterium]|nr:acetate--CoA ligase [Verrucomicrobiota bacterium]
MAFTINSLSGYFHEYQKSVLDPAGFWAGIAESFHWHQHWDRVVDWDFNKAYVRWFEGAKLNITENMLDRHLFAHADKPAIVWEPNDPNEDHRVLTYRQLHSAVCSFASGLRKLGVQKGDRVVIYMPMVPEAAIAMVACARLGAVHSVVFGGFSSQSLSDRINDCSARWVVTSDGAFRGSKTIPLKDWVDQALTHCPTVEKVVVFQRTKENVNMQEGRDLWWDAVVDSSVTDLPAVSVDAEDMLFILYTSGSTGKPKGVVHTCGGYMVHSAYTFQNVFQYKRDHIYWCTADVGWITGHSYIVYGPLLSGATSIMFEGVPTFPDPSRFWQVVDKHAVTHFYTAPTAIRALEAFGNEPLASTHRSTLKVLGSVGEPINEEAWHWYHDQVGCGRCPIVDTWWQTETGAIMISPLAGITPTKPAYATLPLPGVQLMIVDENGKELQGNSVQGNLCIKFPWPGMLRTTYGDHDRCIQTYFSTYKGLYFTGDGVKRDEDGYYRILGRVDDVMNISGHRMGTAEVENAINEHPKVVESAVVGFPHPIKGQGIYAFVIADLTDRTEANLKREIVHTVNNIIGPIAKPDKIQIVPGLPKTRSGKIMRRILRKIAEGETRLDALGDVTTLLDPTVVEAIIAGVEQNKAG